MCKIIQPKEAASKIPSFYFGCMTSTFEEHNTYAGCDSRTTQLRPVKGDPCQLWQIDIIRPLEYVEGKPTLMGKHIVRASIHGTYDVNDLLRFQVQLGNAEWLIRDELAKSYQTEKK